MNETEGKSIHILLLEDDFTLSREIRQYLQNKQMVCDAVYDGNLFFKQTAQQQYDLYLLDINVPGINGLELCQRIREEDKEIPILMLTAFGELEDKVSAFERGADDYLVKPFHFEELYIRIAALLRRKQHPQTESKIIQVEDLQIDELDSRVTRAGKAIQLSPKEYHLLLLLAQAKGRIVSKQAIADRIWDYSVNTNMNTVEVYINFLRKKIDKDFSQKLIQTRPGFGYYLKAE